MTIEKTNLEDIKHLRTVYLRSLPEFQELFIELMVTESECYILNGGSSIISYAICNKEGTLIEFYVEKREAHKAPEIFTHFVKQLSINNIYCKSFDSLLLSCCLLKNYNYNLLGVLYRDYCDRGIPRNVDIKMKVAEIFDISLLSSQHDSIKELFETEQQLQKFIENEKVCMFYRNNEFVGCGTIIRTVEGWKYCDLGVWVKPGFRKQGIATQIILNIREYAINSRLEPTCGCAIDNCASQNTLEKSGFISKHKLIEFEAIATNQ